MEPSNYAYEYFDMGSMNHTASTNLDIVAYFFVEEGGFIEEYFSI